MTLKRSAAITGSGEMKPTGSAEGKTTLGIWTDVSRQAVLDAGLTLSDIDGLLIAIGGIMMITPGLITDVLGFGLILPLLRPNVRLALKRYFRSRMKVVSPPTDAP